MKAIIITIGDEILVGQTIDTNSAHIAKKLNELGISVAEIVSISDTSEHIISAVDNAIKRCDFMFLTGGLGPTNDDITKKVLTAYFKDELVMYPEILKKIETFFEQFNKPMLEVNRHQAMLPKNARIIENELGTASGMWFKTATCQVFSMPGVPYEMKGLLGKFLDELKREYPIGDFYHRTLNITGIGESYLAELIKEWEEINRNEGISVSYLPSVGMLKLRLTGKLNQKTQINERLDELVTKYPKYIIGGEFDTIEKAVGKLLVGTGKKLGTVESCTGGSIAKRLVSVSGSSEFYYGSMISYTNELKEKLVGVHKATLVANGAVSEQVVIEMAENGRQKLGVDYCISVSGIAGPTGGTEEKPVGLVWVAIATENKTYTKKYNFGFNRERNIQATTIAALSFLRLIILNLVED
jgi:nicotinamide-nucleotide amidase